MISLAGIASKLSLEAVVKDVLGSKVRGMCIPTGSSVCKSVGGHGC